MTALAQVLVCRATPNLLTYQIPDHLTEILQVGMHVEVPFGQSVLSGLVMRLPSPYEGEGLGVRSSGATFQLKPILQIQPNLPIISAELISLINWMTDEYRIAPYTAYQTIIGTHRPIMNLEKETQEVTEANNRDHVLTNAQGIAMKILTDPSSPSAQLLLGVTGSGKTELYIHLARHALAQNKDVLMLLPEIALTPQMKAYFEARFGAQVVIVHSGLTPKQRNLAWNRIYQGQCRIVIGPRSAVFSPLKSIGLIIIDEAHDYSYKQDSNPRYHTHHVAQLRADWHKAKLVLGTATASIEQFHAFSQIKNGIVHLRERVNQQVMPKIDTVDSKDTIKISRAILSPELQEAISAALNDKSKVVLLLNRRGYSPYIVCRKCANPFLCPSCNLSFTYHSDRKFRCHRCDITLDSTTHCPKCNAPTLQYGGLGIQKVEAELRQFFPKAHISRLDRDSAKTAKQSEQILSEFRERGDILLGTQMVAKGHHIDDITLVGVLGIDTLLNIPDFRAPERAFQLITQVAGRCGRGTKPGRVIVQTLQPEHYAIAYAKDYRFDQFYQEEIDARHALDYPPFSTLINILIQGPNLVHVQELAKQCEGINVQFKAEFSEETLRIIGPKPAPIEKINLNHRWHILYKCHPDHLSALKRHLKSLPSQFKKARVFWDVDPVTIL